MNISIRYALITAALVAAAKAAPFMAVGDSAELFATGVAGVRFDDNILLANSQGKLADGTDAKISDVIFDLTPGLEFDFGKNAQTQGSITVADAFSLYTQHSAYNTNLGQGDFITKYDDGKTKLSANAGYHELNQNTPDIRGLIRRDVSTLGANGETRFSEKTGFGAGVEYSHENYHPVNYVDDDTFTVPLDLYYSLTPKVDLSLGYQYRDYQVKNNLALSSIDNFYSVGARGEFTPKLTGKFAIGVTQRRFSGQSTVPGTQTGLGLDASFAYEFSPKTTLQFGASNDFGTSPTGAQQKNLTINAAAIVRLNEAWTVNAGISYRGINYYALDTGNIATTTTGRTDDYYEATVGGAYVVNANLRIVGGYTYRKYKSQISASEFNNNVFSVAANLRY